MRFDYSLASNTSTTFNTRLKSDHIFYTNTGMISCMNSLKRSFVKGKKVASFMSLISPPNSTLISLYQGKFKDSGRVLLLV